MKITGAKDTIAWYDDNAAQYSLNTRDNTFEEKVTYFLGKITATEPRILDAGCGDGRDSATLTDSGAVVTGVDFQKAC